MDIELMSEEIKVVRPVVEGESGINTAKRDDVLYVKDMVVGAAGNKKVSDALQTIISGKVDFKNYRLEQSSNNLHLFGKESNQTLVKFSPERTEFNRKILLREGAILENSPIRSKNYQGGLDGRGILIDPTHRSYNEKSGTESSFRSYMELDDLTVRGTFRIYELLAQQIRATNSELWVTTSAKSKEIIDVNDIPQSRISKDFGKFDTSEFKQYQISLEQEEYNIVPFQKGDLIKIRRWDGSQLFISNLLVIEIDHEDTSFIVAWIENTADNEKSPINFQKANLVRIGNTDIIERQGGIKMTSDEGPKISIYNQVSDFNQARPSVQLGDMTDIIDHDFGGRLEGKGGLYAVDNVYIKGNIQIANRKDQFDELLYLRAFENFELDISQLEGQPNNQMDFWFATQNPTDPSSPVYNWEQKDIDSGKYDYYYNTTEEIAYQFIDVEDDGNFAWREVTDTIKVTAFRYVTALDATDNNKIVIFYQNNEPVSPTLGDFWFNPKTGDRKVFLIDEWVYAANSFVGQTGRLGFPEIPSGSGLFLGSRHLGFYDEDFNDPYDPDNPGWKTYKDDEGNFYLKGAADGGALLWNSSQSKLTIVGALRQRRPGDDPTPDPLFQGTWDEEREYFPGDIVLYTEDDVTQAYIWYGEESITGGNVPPDAVDWEIYSSGGGDGQPGSNAKSVKIISDGQYFIKLKDGNVTPNSIELELTSQNLENEIVTWYNIDTGLEITSGTSGDNNEFLSIPESDIVLNDAYRIRGEADGLNDKFTIVKVAEGDDALVTFLTNESHTVRTASDGSGGDYSGAYTDIIVLEGATEITNEYNFSATVIEGEADYEEMLDGNRLVVTGIPITSDNTVLEITGIHDSLPTIKKQFSISKSFAGEAGIPGPGPVSRGVFDPDEFYFKTEQRVDIVYAPDTTEQYWIADNFDKDGTDTWVDPGTTGQEDWIPFGATFDSVATKLLLTEDANITQTLVMGIDDPNNPSPGDGGVIRSATLGYDENDNFDGHGFWLGYNFRSNEYEFFIGETEQEFVQWNGNDLTIKGESYQISKNAIAPSVTYETGDSTVNYDSLGIPSVKLDYEQPSHKNESDPLSVSNDKSIFVEIEHTNPSIYDYEARVTDGSSSGNNDADNVRLLTITLEGRVSNGNWETIKRIEFNIGNQPDRTLSQFLSNTGKYDEIRVSNAIDAENSQIQYDMDNFAETSFSASPGRIYVSNVTLGIRTEGLFQRDARGFEFPLTDVSTQESDGDQINPTWNQLAGKPFESIGDNLIVTNDELTTDLSNLSTGLGLSGSSYDGSTVREFSIDTNIVPQLGENNKFQKNITIEGDLTVNGTEFIANTETIEIEDNLGIINSGETGDGITAGFAGWEVDRGTADNFLFGFQESNGAFSVGKVETVLQAIATREDSPTTGGVSFWDGTNTRFNTNSNLTFDGTNLSSTNQASSDNHVITGSREITIANDSENIITWDVNTHNLTTDPTWTPTIKEHGTGNNPATQSGIINTGSQNIYGVKTVKNNLVIDEHIVSSGDFQSGFGGSGALFSKEFENKGAYLEVDNLTVRETFSVYELLINQIRATNGALWVSSAVKVEEVEYRSDTGLWRCHIDKDQYVPFLTYDENIEGSGNDLIRAQRFTGTNLYLVKAEVINVVNGAPDGNVDDDNEVERYFEISVTSDSPNDPEAGMEFVRIGNTANKDRQGALYLTSDDTGAPFMDVIDDVDSHDGFRESAKNKARLGKLEGILVDGKQLEGYGLYSSNVYLTGSILVGDLNKNGNYLEFDGLDLTGKFGNIDFESDGFKLSSNNIHLESTTNGYFKIGSDSKFIEFDGSDLTGSFGNIDFESESFSLIAGKDETEMEIVSGVGITLGDNDYWKNDKTFSFAGGAISGSATSASIDVDDFNLSATGLTLTSGTDTIDPSLSVGGMKFGVNVSDNNNDGIYIGEGDYWYDDGHLSVGGGKLTWNGSILEIDGSGSFSGKIEADKGDIGGWDIDTNLLESITNGSGIRLRSDTPSMDMYTSNSNHWVLRVSPEDSFDSNIDTKQEESVGEFSVSDGGTTSSNSSSTKQTEESASVTQNFEDFPVFSRVDINVDATSDTGIDLSVFGTMRLEGHDGTNWREIREISFTQSRIINLYGSSRNYSSIRLVVESEAEWYVAQDGEQYSWSYSIEVNAPDSETAIPINWYIPRTIINDRGIFSKVSPYNTISLIDGGGSETSTVISSSVDWDNILDNPFVNKAPNDFADASHNHGYGDLPMTETQAGQWDTAYDERGSQIDGTGLSWSSNNLNVQESFIHNTVNRSVKGNISNIVDSQEPHGKAVIILCPSTSSSNHDVIGRMMTQRSSGNRDLSILDFGYSSPSSGTNEPEYYMEFATGDRERVSWEFVTFDYDGTNWIGLYFDSSRYTISDAWFTGVTKYNGDEFLQALNTTDVSNLTEVDFNQGNKEFRNSISVNGSTVIDSNRNAFGNDATFGGNLEVSGNGEFGGNVTGDNLNIARWDTAHDRSPIGLEFSNGTLTLDQQVGTETVSLDGRYGRLGEDVNFNNISGNEGNFSNRIRVSHSRNWYSNLRFTGSTGGGDPDYFLLIEYDKDGTERIVNGRISGLRNNIGGYGHIDVAVGSETYGNYNITGSIKAMLRGGTVELVKCTYDGIEYLAIKHRRGGAESWDRDVVFSGVQNNSILHIVSDSDQITNEQPFVSDRSQLNYFGDDVRVNGDLQMGSTTVIDSDQNFTGNDGTFSGDVEVGGKLESDDFQSHIIDGKGWGIDPNAPNGSYFEIDNLRVRKEFRTHLFVKEAVRATNGRLYVSDASEVAEEKTFTSGSSTLDIKAGLKYATFSIGDTVLIRSVAPDNTSINNVELIVTDVDTSDSDVTTLSVDVAEEEGQFQGGTVYEGDTIVRTSGATLLLDADDNSAPYMDAIDDGTLKTRVGNLLSIPNAVGYGLWGQNTFLTGNLLVGDLTKGSGTGSSGKYLEYSDGDLTGSFGNIDFESDSFTLTAEDMSIKSADGISIGNDYWNNNGEFQFGGSDGIRFPVNNNVRIGSDVDIFGNLSVSSLPRVSDEGLEGLWRFDYRGGESIIDSKNGNNGVISGSVTATDSPTGYGVDFNSGGEINISNASEVKLGTYTYIFWLYRKIGGSGSYRNFINQGPSRSPGVWLNDSGDDMLHFSIETENSGNESINPSGVLIDEWNFIELSVEQIGSDFQMIARINNKIEASRTISNNSPIIGNGNLSIGEEYVKLSELRVYNRVLTDNERKSLYLYPSGNSGGLISANTVRTGVLKSSNDNIIFNLDDGTLDANDFDIQVGASGDFWRSSDNKFQFGGTSGIKFPVGADNKVEIGSDVNVKGDITGASGTFSGKIEAGSGDIGGWDIFPSELSKTLNNVGSLTLNSTENRMELASEFSGGLLGSGLFDTVHITPDRDSNIVPAYEFMNESPDPNSFTVSYYNNNQNLNSEQSGQLVVPSGGSNTTCSYSFDFTDFTWANAEYITVRIVVDGTGRATKRFTSSVDVEEYVTIDRDDITDVRLYVAVKYTGDYGSLGVNNINFTKSNVATTIRADGIYQSLGGGVVELLGRGSGSGSAIGGIGISAGDNVTWTGSHEFNSNFQFTAASGGRISNIRYTDANWASQSDYLTMYIDSTGEYPNGFGLRTHADESGWNWMFRVTHDGNLTVPGTLSASGYNPSSWNTAYDHSQIESGNPHNLGAGDVNALPDSFDDYVSRSSGGTFQSGINVDGRADIGGSSGVRIGSGSHTSSGYPGIENFGTSHLMIDSAGGGNLYLNWHASGGVYVGSGGNVTVELADGSGSVSIGRNRSPSYKLDVNGYINGTRFYQSGTRRDAEWNEAYNRSIIDTSISSGGNLVITKESGSETISLSDWHTADRPHGSGTLGVKRFDHKYIGRGSNVTQGYIPLIKDDGNLREYASLTIRGSRRDQAGSAVESAGRIEVTVKKASSNVAGIIDSYHLLGETASSTLVRFSWGGTTYIGIKVNWSGSAQWHHGLWATGIVIVDDESQITVLTPDDVSSVTDIENLSYNSSTNRRFSNNLRIDNNLYTGGISEATNHVGGSDRRIKSNFQQLSGLEIIRKAGNLYSYEKEGIEEREVGQIAQDLLFCDDLVHKSPHERLGEMYSLSGLSLAGVAMNGVKELDLEFQQTKSEVDILKDRVQELEQEIETLRRN